MSSHAKTLRTVLLEHVLECVETMVLRAHSILVHCEILHTCLYLQKLVAIDGKKS